ncbi:transcriptional regulators [Moorella thermoacetica Y72]|uniref:Transcriptional regulators n=1 Tax=Moorella thermoacetica Y72 TaxID=1325331 RepID=A0A0S6UA59_NEOTH|nr:transcriptional regulators [Moorella thermoacetica Y72]
MAALQDLFETANGFLQGHINPGLAGKSLGYVEGLGEETLDLACPGNYEFIFFGQLIHSQDGDNVLKFFITLQYLLDAPGHLVVLFSQDARVQDTGGGVQGVDGRVDAQLSDLPGQNRGGVQMGEGRRRGRVGQVVGRHIDSLHGGDGTLFRGGNPFLEGPHLRGQGGLITHRRGHPAQEGGNLGTGLHEAKDIVDEEEDVLALGVPEVLGHSQACKTYPQAGTRGFVHLAKDQGRLFENPGFLHLQVEVVTLAGTLAHAAEDGKAAVFIGDVADEFHDEDRLADPGAAEEADLAALGVGRQEVDHLDASLQDLGRRLLLFKGGRRPVNGQPLGGFYRSLVVNGFSQDVKEPSQGSPAYRYGDWLAGVNGLHPSLQAVGRGEGHAADGVVAQVLHGLHGYINLIGFNGDGVIQVGQPVAGEFDVNHRANNLDHLSFVQTCPLLYFKASAPATISRISLVMAAWRARLKDRVNLSIISAAFLVALSMAVIRAPCSLALASRRAR